jgi:tetratricopeptide (TPR) repeat protein
MTEDKKQGLIEGYHRGNLSEEDQLLLISLKENDPEFALEIEQYQFIFSGFDSLYLESFQNDIALWEQKHKISGTPSKVLPLKDNSPKQPKHKFNLGFYILVAAILTGLIVVPALYRALNAEKDLFAELYKTPIAMIIAVRGDADENPGDSKTQALRLFNDRNFQEAAEMLKIQLLKSPSDSEILYYMGISQMETKHFTEAKSYFDKISDRGFFGQAAQWYGLLCDYKNGNLKSATESAKAIAADQNHNFYEKAKEYLKLTKQ